MTMKKQTLILFTAVMLLLATLLCSCGGAGNLKFSKVVDADGYTDTVPTLTSATALTLKGDVTDYAGNLVLFTDESKDTVSVYNVSEDKVVYTATDSTITSAGKIEEITYSVDLMIDHDVAWFSVIKTVRSTNPDAYDFMMTDREVGIYDAKGVVMLSGKDLSGSFDVVEDLVFLNDKIYRVSMGTLTEIWTSNGLTAMPAISKKAGKGYVGSKENSISLYSEKMELIASYIIPSYAGSKRYFVTENGNVIVQYAIECEEDAKDYDVFLEGKKLNVKTVLLNKKNSNGKELRANYFLQSLSSGDALKGNGIDASVGNFALGYIIEDRRVDENVYKLFSLANDGKIKGYIDGFVPGDTRQLTMVYENRWMVTTWQGYRYLLDKKGKSLGEIGGYADYSKAGILSKNHKLYGWNLDLIADFNEQGVVSSCTLLQKGVLVFMKNGDVLYYTSGNTTTVARGGEEKNVRALSERQYIVENKDGSKVIYNDLGQQVYSLQYGTAVINNYDLGAEGVLVRLNTFENGESYVLFK